MAAELKIKAEHKLGTLLKGMEKQAGARGHGKKVELHDATPLKELGIEKTASHRWQRLAEVTFDRLERTLKQLREAEQDITTAAVLRAFRPEP